MKLLNICNRAIEFLFYGLFLIVPLIFAGNTSELFEFNKMWIAYGITIAIGFFWITKMLILKRFVLKRTLLDIPILLFLASQIISTIISWDQYTSLWGYYSRFNGGLFSTITYVFLFYAFVSNFFNIKEVELSNREKKNQTVNPGFFDRVISGKTMVIRCLEVSILSGFLVILWALPSHFGYDPTCLIFRGHLDVSCWTNDFQPKIRIFGTLGQPDWLAGYLGVLLPITAAFALNILRKTKDALNPKLLFYTLCFVLFYLSLLFTGSRFGIFSGGVGIITLGLSYLYLNRKNVAPLKNRFLYGVIALIVAISFIVGVSLPGLDKISLTQLQSHFQKSKTTSSQTATAQAQPPVVSSSELGGSNSFAIRKIVWKGAVDVWKANPLFGTGVETFAYSYYKYRPIEHNRVSEWNFLYNKAHNEYLNYLATTGAFGLLTYLAFIGLFLAFVKVNILNLKFNHLNFLKTDEKWDNADPLVLGLFASFISILVINFGGFSVVILNIYLFLIPAFALILLGSIKGDAQQLPKNALNSYVQWIGVTLAGIVALFMIFILVKYWIADTKYALGSNYSQSGQYQTAYPLLKDAVKLRREPVFLDQMSVNDAILATSLALQGSSQSANLVQGLATEALTTSDQLTKTHPKNIVFWKSRVRILYTLANVDPRFMPLALTAIKKAAELAPTDATVLYNLGVLYGQTGDSKNAVMVLEKTVAYRPEYTDAHFALGVFYHEVSVNKKSGRVTDPASHQKALNQMNYILKNIDPNFAQAKQYLDAWSKEN